MKLIIASNSPRRKELIAGLGIEFDVYVIKGIDESFPSSTPTDQVAEYIAKKKAAPYKEWFSQPSMIPKDVHLTDDTIIITADTVVALDNKIMGKPNNREDAYNMLKAISGRKHQVYTGVCLLGKDKETSFTACTDVTFRTLTDNEIHHYIDTFHPMDKAGAYGIQEWIGYIGVTNLNGSYFNVMGLPVQRIYDALQLF